MAKFVCVNDECPDRGNIEIIPEMKFRLREGKLLPVSYPLCVTCMTQMEYMEPEAGPVGLNFNRFGSLSNDDKKRWIRKRNEKVKKDDEEKKRYYQKKQLGFNLD